MRIESFRLANYRGIRLAEIEALANTPVVTLSGPNGAGKSLLLEAIAGLWQEYFPNTESLVGPWGDTAELELRLALSDEERKALIEFLSSEELPEPVLRSVLHRNGMRNGTGDSHVYWQAFRSQVFQTEHPFCRIDFLPADRAIPRREAPSVNPALLGEEQARELRQRVLESVFEGRRVVQLSGVQPFLASLDYLELVAQRERMEAPRDFEVIAGAFQQATGKTISRPRLDQTYGASIRVTTPSGAEHGIDELSSGEQEVLGLMYFVRRLSAQGGVLLIDEPELHLHPALQRSLFSVIETIAGRSQVWMATHSPKLIAAAPLISILHMKPAAAKEVNQIIRASDELARLDLITDLGMSPVELLQSDTLVVVEGPTDAQRLAGLLPIEMGRAAVYEAGGFDSVEAVARTLETGNSPLPWLCIRDRDLMTDHEVSELEQAHPGLFIWPERCLENELLYSPLIQRTLARAGRECDLAEIEAELRAFADQQREDIGAVLVENRLHVLYAHEPGPAPSKLDRIRTSLEGALTVTQQKLDNVDRISTEVQAELAERWERDWHKLMDGKRVLRQYRSKTPFAKLNDFIAALEATASSDETVRPPGVADLQRRLRDIRPRR